MSGLGRLEQPRGSRLCASATGRPSKLGSPICVFEMTFVEEKTKISENMFISQVCSLQRCLTYFSFCFLSESFDVRFARALPGAPGWGWRIATGKLKGSEILSQLPKPRKCRPDRKSRKRSVYEVIYIKTKIKARL